MANMIAITVFLISVLLFGIAKPAHAERLISVNFATADLRVTDLQGILYLYTPIVLPKRSYYQVPVQGTVRLAVMGPKWIPTPNTHLELPGRFKEYYGPYEPGNAMGHCKIYIDFDRDDASLRYVRIHGNGNYSDLGKRLSRSCIRVPDDLCPYLVSAVAGYQGRVRVHFHD